MYSCLKSFAMRSGTGTQTVSGIADAATGVAFTGKLFIFLYGFANLNALTADAGFTDAFALGCGLDNGTNAGASMMADAAEFSPTNHVVSTGNAPGQSLIDVRANAFFGGDSYRKAYVSAVASGSFTLNFTQNDRTGDYGLVLVLGGSDLDVNVTAGINNGTVTTPSIPQGVLTVPVLNWAAHGGVVTLGAGGGSRVFGFDVRDAVRGAVGMATITNAGSSRFSSDDRDSATFNATTLNATAPAVTTWGASSYDITGASSSVGNSQVAFCGANIKAASGVFDIPTTPGDIYIDTGIEAQVVFLMSNGADLLSTLRTDVGEVCVGIVTSPATAPQQGSYWTAEIGTWAVGDAVPGVRWLSDTSALRFGTPNGGATTISVVAAAAASGDSRVLKLSFSTVDGTARQVQWMAVGAPFTAPAATTFMCRRLRRFPLPFDRSLWVYLSRLEILIQSGEGLVDGSGQGTNPKLQLRFSGDGGRTWGNWIQISAGKIGEYDLQAVVNRIGKLRNGLCEVAVSDPIYWYLLQAFGTAEEQANT